MLKPLWAASSLTIAALAASLGAPQLAFASVPAAPASARTESTLVAQSAPVVYTTGSQRSISVSGTGQASAPADAAVMVLNYFLNYYPEYSESNPVPPPPPAVQPSDYQAIVSAITGAGVPAGNVTATVDPTSSGSLRIRVRLDRPSSSQVAQIITAANAAATRENKVAPSGASVGYMVNNCQAAEAEAQRAAMSDAQNRLAALASLAGVETGRLVSISDFSSWGSTSSYVTTCPLSSSPLTYSDPFSVPPFDASLPAQVTVTSQISASYEIAD